MASVHQLDANREENYPLLLQNSISYSINFITICQKRVSIIQEIKQQMSIKIHETDEHK